MPIIRPVSKLPGLTAALAGLAAAGSLILGPAAPAEALAGPSHRCPEGYVCFWSGPDFTGTMYVWHNPVSHYCDPTPPQPARTIYNNDDEAWAFYRDLDCTTLAVTLPPGRFARDTEAYSWK
ncbi:peptidase inhibitor family I36 protein [Actinomadura sp. 3N508]|uniref:peptidase inhibitor family I36 protein n=1 Tax=Actinomadura sp. 3N508 TaxID=3375153 RepID=UPI003787C506